MKTAILLAAGILAGMLTAQGQPLRVMTYNIRYDNPGDGPDRWDARKAFLISQVAYHHPDIVGTQEGLAHQLEAMDAGLEGYAFFGVGRDRGDREGEYSAIFYRTDRLELLEESTFWLSPTPGQPSKGWDAALNRICTYGKFRSREGGRTFLVFNTHFDHVGEKARSESVGLILRKIAEINRDGLPVVLTGDLNLEPGSGPIHLLAEAMDDTRTLAGEKAYGPEGTFNGFDCTEAVTRRIDYIFTGRGDFRLQRYATLAEFTGTGFPSDHFPVLVELELN